METLLHDYSCGSVHQETFDQCFSRPEARRFLPHCVTALAEVAWASETGAE